MRHGRAKAARKTLLYFKRTVGLQTRPFLPVLLDGCFLVALFQHKIPTSRIERVLQVKSSFATSTGETELSLASSDGIKYFVTQEAVSELETIKDTLEKRKTIDKVTAFQDTLSFVKSQCTILKQQQATTNNSEKRFSKKRKRGLESHMSPTEVDKDTSTASTVLSSQEALLNHISSDTRVYVVASQDERILDTLRAMGTVPIVRLANNSVLLLEQPSKSSQSKAMGEERSKWKNTLPSVEKALVEVAKEQIKSTKLVTNSKTHVTPRMRKKRKAKGPNPLSCKRKQFGWNDSYS